MMQVSARSYLTAGVALVGASAIALTPVAPPTPSVELRAAVTHTANLMANPTPLQLWAEVIGTSVDNAAAITQSVLANPAPVLEQVIKNQLGNASLLVEALQGTANIALPAIADLPETIRTALVQLANGNVKGAAETLLAPVFTVGFGVLMPVAAVAEAVRTTTQNVANAIAVLVDPLNILGALVAVGGPILSAVNALVDSAQAAVDGVMAGDLGAVATALINVPANLVGAVLNGHGTMLGFIQAPGLLTPSDPDAGPLGFSGPLAYVQSLREQIGKAIAPPEPELQMLSETVDESDVSETPVADEDVTVDDTADTSVDKSVVVNVDENTVENVAEKTATVETGGVDETVTTLTTAKTETVKTETVATGTTENTTSSVETNSGAGTAVNTGPSEQEKRAAAAEERKAKREAARAERQAEREAQREAKRAERQAKQAESTDNGASPTNDSDSGQSEKNDQAA